MAVVQFAAQAYRARSKNLLNQQAINAFVETAPADATTPVPVFGTPGLRTFSRMPLSTGPIRGMHVMGDNLYVVSGKDLYVIYGEDVRQAPALTSVDNTLIGTTTLGNFVSMADNGRQLMMVDGVVGWIYQPGGLNQVSTANAIAGSSFITCNITGTILLGATLNIPLDDGTTFVTTSTFQVDSSNTGITLNAPLPWTVTSGATIICPTTELGQIMAEAFHPAATVQYFDGYFVMDRAGTREFGISAVNDGTQYSALDIARASASSAEVLAVRVYHEQLLIFTTANIEVWWNTGNASFPFQRYDAAFVERGLAAALAIANEDNTVFWMGDDGIAYRLDGFAPVRISTFAMEWAWSQYPDKYLDCSCFVLNQEGHKFLVFNFISGEATWVYDISTGLWHQRESLGLMWV